MIGNSLIKFCFYFYLSTTLSCAVVPVAAELEALSLRAATARSISRIVAGGITSKSKNMGLTSRDLLLLSRFVLHSENSNSIRDLVYEAGRIQVRRWLGYNPQLFIKDADYPFAEIFPHSGQIKFFTGDIINFRLPVYSVENYPVDLVHWQNGNMIYLTTLYPGDLVLKYNDSNGWAQIHAVRDGIEYIGYVDNHNLYPLFN